MNKISTVLIFFFLSIIPKIHSQQFGNASYYSHKLAGHHTSDGGRYYPDSMTCAHRFLPFGTYVKVRNPKNDREVFVKVTDRGPYNRHLLIDVSYRAAKELDIVRAGVAFVEITRLDSLPPVYPQPVELPVLMRGLALNPQPVIIKSIQVKKSFDNIKNKNNSRKRRS